MMERLAQMVGAPAPVQLLEVQRYYAIDLSEARMTEAKRREMEERHFAELL
jgi:hypothetical protein